MTWLGDHQEVTGSLASFVVIIVIGKLQFVSLSYLCMLVMCVLPHSAQRKDLSYPKGIEGWAEELVLYSSVTSQPASQPATQPASRTAYLLRIFKVEYFINP